jgi:membrane associated rhomboid family serine protease
MAEDTSTFELRWPFSASATFVGLMWIAYAWSIWAAGGVEMKGGILGFGALPNDGYYVAGALSTEAVLEGREWERIVSAIFLHIGFLHILMNSAAILQLGRVLEIFTTRGRCWFTLLFSGLCGSLASILWAMITGKPSASAGASGAGCGLGTALIVLSRGIPALTEFRNQMITWTVVMLGLGLTPMISGTGHVGGAIGGVLAGLVVRRRGSMQMASDGYARLLDRLTVVLTLVFAAALAVNAWKATGRRAAIDELRVAVNDVHGWLDAGKAPDPSDWIRNLESLDLWGPQGRRRDALVGVAEGLREVQQATGTIPPIAAEVARLRLGAFSAR